MSYYQQGRKSTVYGRTSTARIMTLHESLSMILLGLAEDGWEISVIDGERGEERQNKAFREGKSNVRYPMSMHNNSPSLAVDIAPYILRQGIPWQVENSWVILAGAFIAKAQELNIAVRWGGLFDGLKDLGHFELTNAIGDSFI